MSIVSSDPIDHRQLVLWRLLLEVECRAPVLLDFQSFPEVDSAGKIERLRFPLREGRLRTETFPWPYSRPRESS